MYDILAELQKQDKEIVMCKVLAHIQIKGSEEADKSVNKSIDIQGITMTILTYTDYYLTIRRAKNSK